MKRSKFTDSQIMEALKRVVCGGCRGRCITGHRAWEMPLAGLFMPCFK